MGQVDWADQAAEEQVLVLGQAPAQATLVVDQRGGVGQLVHTHTIGGGRQRSGHLTGEQNPGRDLMPDAASRAGQGGDDPGHVVTRRRGCQFRPADAG